MEENTKKPETTENQTKPTKEKPKSKTQVLLEEVEIQKNKPKNLRINGCDAWQNLITTKSATPKFILMRIPKGALK